MIETLVRTFLLVFAIFAFTILAIELLPNISAYRKMYATQEFVAFSNNFKQVLAYCVASAIANNDVALYFTMPASIQGSQIFVICKSDSQGTRMNISAGNLRTKFILPPWIRCSFHVTSGKPQYVMVCEKLNNTILINIQ